MSDDDLVRLSDSPACTEALGTALGEVLRAGDLLVLDGPLGAGKTCLVRGIVAGAGGDPSAVRSPTFVLHQPHRGRSITVHHLDLFRLGPGAAVDVLDLEGAAAEGAVVMEWGGYADLQGLEPFTLSISASDSGRDHRVLRLVAPVPQHVARAWEASPSGRAGR